MTQFALYLLTFLLYLELVTLLLYRCLLYYHYVFYFYFKPYRSGNPSFRAFLLHMEIIRPIVLAGTAFVVIGWRQPLAHCI